MASVTSLDADMRSLRLSRYTPQASAEARAWIESILQTDLPAGDLLEALKDGTILCQLANLAITPQHGAIRWKKSGMPFMQMENISHFLRACEMPPLSLPAHDRFLTVDLFEAKDAAQVLQCLGAFSRQANRINPAAFPTTIGPKKAAAAAASSNTTAPSFAGSNNGSAKSSSGTPVSSWSKKSDEGYTAPAWNIAQYGYLGGASQGNQGVTFGARRQITSQAPTVPSLAGKEQARKEKLLAEEQQRQQEADAALRRERAAAEEEERTKQEEALQWEAEAEKLREEERKHLEQQKIEWEAQERKWQDEEAARRKTEALSLNAATDTRPNILRGQSLSEYQREQAQLPQVTETPDQLRVRELEKELEAAKERERQYQAEREGRLPDEPRSASRPSTAMTQTSQTQSETSWNGDERNYVTQQPQNSGERAQIHGARPLPAKPSALSNEPSASTPEQVVADNLTAASEPPSISRMPPQVAAETTSTSRSPFARPLPVPRKPDSILAPKPFIPNRTDKYLSSNAAPQDPAPRISAATEAGDTSLEQSRDRDVRLAAQQKTKAGAWASKSLLEKEMERERERQREWEANQQALKDAPRDESQGVGQGQTWDVNQYGYTGGDNMNRGSGVGSGINFGGRRQVVGPRPKP